MLYEAMVKEIHENNPAFSVVVEVDAENPDWVEDVLRQIRATFSFLDFEILRIEPLNDRKAREPREQAPARLMAGF